MSYLLWGEIILILVTVIFYIVFFSLIYYWHEKKETVVILPLIHTFEFFLIGSLIIGAITLIQYLTTLL